MSQYGLQKFTGTHEEHLHVRQVKHLTIQLNYFDKYILDVHVQYMEVHV